MRVAGWGAGALPRHLALQGVCVEVTETSESLATWQRALLNRHAAPDEGQMNRIIRLSRDPSVVRRFSAWNHVWFSPEETTWLGIWHHHIHEQTWEEADRDFVTAVVLGTIRTWLEANRDGIQLKSRPPLTMLRLHWEHLERQCQELRETDPPRATAAGQPTFVGYVAENGGTWSGSEPRAMWDGWMRGKAVIDTSLPPVPAPEPAGGEQAYWVSSSPEGSDFTPVAGAKLVDRIEVAHPLPGGGGRVSHAIWFDARATRKQGKGLDDSDLASRPARKELDRT